MSKRAGIIYVVAAPSGTGKTSLVKAAVERLSRVQRCTSHTTRPKRPQEIEGQDYYFVNQDQFDQMVNTHQFIEHTYVFSQHYGTSIAAIDQVLSQGEDVILDIDWLGARSIKQHYKQQAVCVFLLPPSKQVLFDRLCKRNQDNTDVIAQRMLEAKNQMQHYNEFDYILINDNFGQTVDNFASIIVAERMRLVPQCSEQASLITSLLEE